MPHRFDTPERGLRCERGHHRARQPHLGSIGRPTGPRLRGALALLFLLLAPSSVRAQDRSALQATATVLPAQPSQGALGDALRLASGQPMTQAAERPERPRLARLTVRRPSTAGDSSVVVSIEFLHN